MSRAVSCEPSPQYFRYLLFAAGGEFGILEGRTAALIHPAVMGGLFVASVYAGYLGWQWRRTRTIGDDIKALKAQLPKPAAEGEPAPASPLTAQIAGLEKVRAAGPGMKQQQDSCKSMFEQPDTEVWRTLVHGKQGSCLLQGLLTLLM
jgi:hypothetical protein